MYRILFILLAALALPMGTALGQALEEEEGYSQEFTYGVNFNTNGGLLGGVMIKQVYHLGGSWYHFWAVEAVEVQHPKEKPPRQNQFTGSSFKYGKSNYLFVLRPQYGREYTFFRKAAESGVQVNGLVAAGPSIGILAPYFIQYDYTSYNNGAATGPIDVRTEQYDPAIHTQPDTRIVGSAGVFQGLSQPSLTVGANVKAGVSFEYGRYMESVTGIEVGVMYEAFVNEIPLIPQATNRQGFTSVYLTLYYGRRR